MTLVALSLGLICLSSFELGGEKKTKGAAIQFVSVDRAYCPENLANHPPSERICHHSCLFIVSLVQMSYDINGMLPPCTIHERLL